MKLDNEGARFFWPDHRPLLAAPPARLWRGAPLAPTSSHLAASGITVDASAGDSLRTLIHKMVSSFSG